MTGQSTDVAVPAVGLSVMAAAAVGDGALWCARGLVTRVTGGGLHAGSANPAALLPAVVHGPHLHAVVAVAVVLFLLAVVPPAVLGVRAWLRYDTRRRRRLESGADSRAWASRRDVKDLLAPAGSGRLVLGHLEEL